MSNRVIQRLDGTRTEFAHPTRPRRPTVPGRNLSARDSGSGVKRGGSGSHLCRLSTSNKGRHLRAESTSSIRGGRALMTIVRAQTECQDVNEIGSTPTPGSAQGRYNSSVFAAMMKSLRCRP
jgi:hypothetical protein